MTNQLILLEPDLFDTGAATAGSAARAGRARSASSSRSTPSARSSASRSTGSAASGGRRARVTGSGGGAAADAGADRSQYHSDDDGADDDGNEYHLDEHTRAVGRAGLAAARQALADAVRRSEERRGGPVGDPSTRIAA